MKNLINLNKKLIDQNKFDDLFTTGLLNESLVDEFSKNFNIELFAAKEIYNRNFGFSLLNKKLIDVLSSQLKNDRVIEVGAGSGFLGSLLLENGIDYQGIDLDTIENNKYGFQKQFSKILKYEASEFLNKNKNFDSIIMSWPNYGTDFAFNVLKNIPVGKRLYYCGEGMSGCTANDDFFDLINEVAILDEKLSNKLNKNYISWPGIHDRWYVFNIEK